MAQGSTARKPVGHQLATLRKTVEHDTELDANNRVKVGVLPAGAHIHSLSAGTKETFDGTAILTVGTDGTTAANIAAAGDIDEGTLGGALVNSGAQLDITSDSTVWAKLAHGTTTSSSTQGRVDLVLAYDVDDEGE